METFLIKAAQLVLALVILVTVHEFGHYLFARIFGMRVDRFYLFFNPYFSLLKYDPRAGRLQLIAWTRRRKDADKDSAAETDQPQMLGTEPDEEPRALLNLRIGRPHPAKPGAKPTWRDTLYGLGWLPLGGYCSIAGMIDETTDKDQLASEPQPWEFRAKKPVPRLLVMVAGVLFNFLLAIAIYIGIAWHWGDVVLQPANVSAGYQFDTTMHHAGYRDGDILKSINGKDIDALTNDSWIMDLVQDGARIGIVRNGRDTVITNPAGTFEAAAGVGKRAILAPRIPAVVAKVAPGEGAEKAGILTGDVITRIAADTVTAFNDITPILSKYPGKDVPVQITRDGKAMVLTTHVNDDGKLGIGACDLTSVYPCEHVSYGFFESIPVGISKGVDRLASYVTSLKLLFTKTGAQSLGGFGAIGDMYPGQWDCYSFWQITAFLSVILAFMNILPIPALDGGHVVFTLWEIVTQRKPSLKVLSYSQYAGMMFLLLLLIYANANDIYRFFIK